MTFCNLHEVEALARGILPAATFDYFAGGACDELTLAENRRAFEGIALRPHVLVDVSHRELGISLLGTAVSAPIVVAPMAFQRLAHQDGELGMARAAGALGLLMTASTFSTCSLEEIAAAASGPLWFQLYVHQDREITRDLVQRAAAAGYRALVLTVDVPEIGRRERDDRNAFRLSADLRVANFKPKSSEPLQGGGGAEGSHLAHFIHGMRDASFSWKDLEWLRSLVTLPLVLKGILRADDAQRAIEHGANGIVVSNHGGRQLDTAITGLRVLPEIAVAVGDKALVMLDGGIRRGTDIMKALALGARAVMVGRPALWGLAVDGEVGAHRVLALLRNELDLAMALCGTPRLTDIGKDLLA
ncbi:MAG TPA: alpha-hydroxy acid oxidase [Gemmatimonadales bacterium]|nr:alpha-hydroxy acid oxidase [Gemmatimonadales bacterium]